MAKLIKRDQGAPDLGIHEQETQVGGELPQRRGPIIDRGTFEAKHEAVSIRDRAEAQAAEKVAAAEAKAEQIVADAEAEAERLRQAAKEEGLHEGRQEGAIEYVSLCAQVREEAQAAQSALAPQISKLAMAIARRVLGRELEFSPEMVVELVKKTLGDKARQRRDVTLRVHPDDAKHLREHKVELLEIVSRSKDIRIQEDPEVALHGVIIETEAGVIDAQLETQLGALERALAAVA